MNKDLKDIKIKINGLFLISLLLCAFFGYFAFSKLKFLIINVEEVLIDKPAKTTTQKSFNTQYLDTLKTKYPLP